MSGVTERTFHLPTCVRGKGHEDTQRHQCRELSLGNLQPGCQARKNLEQIPKAENDECYASNDYCQNYEDHNAGLRL
jgi:hypothetical protein